MKKIRDLFTKNIGWKLVSLFIAIVLWFISVNITNPIQSKPYRVKLTVLGKEKLTQNNFVILNESNLERTINIKVRASKSSILELDQVQGSIEATIDLTPMDITYDKNLGEDLSLLVDVKLPTYLKSNDLDYELQSIEPSKVVVRLDKYVSKTVPVLVERPTDEANSGFVSMMPVATPDSVLISGPKTIVDQVESVRTSVEIKNATEDINTKGSLIAYDANKLDITNQIEMNINQVDILVPINRYAKIPIAIPTILGDVAEGYTMTGVTWEPRYVEIVGSIEDIEKMKEIELKPIPLNYTDKDKTLVVDLRGLLVDTKLSIKNGTPNEVKVNIKIEEELTKELEVPISKIQIMGMTSNFEILDLVKFIKTTIKGPASKINEINENNISCFIDLTGLEAGDHDVEVKFDMSSTDIQILEPSTLRIAISEESIPVATATDTDAPIENRLPIFENN